MATPPRNEDDPDLADIRSLSRGGLRLGWALAVIVLVATGLALWLLLR